MKRKIIISGILVFFFTSMGIAQTKTAITSKEAKINSEISLSDADIEVFKEQTRQKVDEFTQHIVTIGNKAEAPERRNLAEKEALKLFFAGAEMEVSSLSPDGSTRKVARPMVKYLARLKSLPFTRVVIRFYDIAYVSEFTKGPDGRYYSVATVIQEFTGFSGDNIIYTDVTKKEIEIIIDLVDDPFFNQKSWKIFLGDIKASETRKTEKP
jgi:hypothetical protein